MESQASSKKTILNYGLYYGIASIIVSVIFYALNMHLEQGIASTLIGFAMMIAFIVLAQRQFKLENNNILAFWTAVKIGMGVIMLGSLLYLIYNQVFINFIEPDTMEQAMALQRQKWEEANMTSDQIEAAEDMARRFSGPLISSAFILVAAGIL